MLLSALICTFNLYGQEIKTYNVPESGKLGDIIGDDSTTIESIKVTGKINAEDIETIRKISWFNKLRNVDLSETEIDNGEIPEYAFFNEEQQYIEDKEYGVSLKTFIFPKNTTKIGDYAFYMAKLEKLTLPNELTSIGEGAFYSCSNIKTESPLVIPKNIKKITSMSFYGCLGITKIKLNEGLEKIEQHAFNACGIEEINFPSTLKSIGNASFGSCNFATLDLPNTVVEWGKNAFEKNQLLKKISLPNNMTEIPLGFLINAIELEKITIPNSVKTIGESAFQYCNKLKEIKLSDNLQVIKDDAFQGCMVTSLTLPENLKEIKKGAFYNIETLVDITCNAITPPIMEKDGMNKNATPFEFSNSMSQRTLYVPKESIDKYKEAIGWKEFSNIKPIKGTKTYVEGKDYKISEDKKTLEKWMNTDSEIDLSDDPILSNIDYIGNHCFMMNASINKIILPNNLKGIKSSAFYFSALKEINIPKTVNIIEGNPFAGCSMLQIVTIDTNNNSYKSEENIIYSKDGKRLISYSAGLKANEFVIPNDVEVLGEQSFSGNAYLTSIRCPESLKEIKAYAFEDNESLMTAILNNGLEIIEFAAFYNTALENINIPSSVKVMGSNKPGNPFINDKSLKTISIADDSKYLINKNGIIYAKDMSTLYACPAQAEIADFFLPCEVKILGEGAFNSQEKLRKFTMNQHINLPARLFEGANNLNEVNLLTGTDKIEISTFDNNALNKIKIMGMNIPLIYNDEYAKSFGQNNLKNVSLTVSEKMKEAFENNEFFRTSMKEIITEKPVYTFHSITHHQEIDFSPESGEPAISNKNIIGYQKAIAYGRLAGTASLIYGNGSNAIVHLIDVKETKTEYKEPYLDFDNFTTDKIEEYESKTAGRTHIEDKKEVFGTLKIYASPENAKYQVKYLIAGNQPQKYITVVFDKKSEYKEMHVENFIQEHYLPGSGKDSEGESFNGYAFGNVGIEINELNVTDDNEPVVNLLYSNAKSFEENDSFTVATKTIANEEKVIRVIGETIVSSSPINYIVIFNMNGQMVSKMKLAGESACALPPLASGPYVIVANTNKGKSCIKINK